MATRLRNPGLLLLAVAAVCPSTHAFEAKQNSYRGWSRYGGGDDNIRYSKLKQITKQNVGHLQVAWTFDTRDAFPGSEMQCNPIVVDGILYATTPKARVIALDAATGALKWAFDPSGHRPVTSKQRARGLMYWQSGEE